MPELPEVEVSKLGISPHMVGERVTRVVVRNGRLRWPVSEDLPEMEGQIIRRIERRAKYLLLHTDIGYAIVHLGMSGNLRVLPVGTPPAKHDHVDLELANGLLLRYHDPRRFGAWLWQSGTETHSVLSKLGPEPLHDEFTVEGLWEKAQKRRVPIKSFIMDNAVVVGVGNIYANESLFSACISPLRPANQVSKAELTVLVAEIKQVLSRAIEQGGTTLKDFKNADGKPGYFVQELQVYGKQGQPCPICEHVLEGVKIGQRATTYCPQCQR